MEFTLPDDLYACDIAVFTVWCQLASVQFSVLEIPQDLFVSCCTSTNAVQCCVCVCVCVCVSVNRSECECE